MARVIGFAWSSAASVDVRVSAFDSTGYLLNGNRMPEYFDTGETITSVATTCPNMAPVGAATTS
jgi:hypothetical protein